jgi:heme/copper-type cytochrome/quinol oxidase subunit 3
LFGGFFDFLLFLLLTVFLGVYFSFLQGIEYLESSFSLRDSSYGTIFFVATGFHGLHVLIGSLFLLRVFFRALFFHFSRFHLIGFEASIWY